MKLASRSQGTGPHVAFVHGFTQTSHSWDAVARDLPRFTCQLIDAPGHGDSTDACRTLSQCGEDIAQTMFPGALVGYSMGARMALHTALLPETPVERLVLVSGTAGIELDGERKTRITSDEQLAARIEQIGTSAFIAEWLANPMFAGLTTATSQISERERNTSTNLANSLRFAGTGTQEPLWGQLNALEMPVLIIAGERDEKFVQLAHRMNDLIPHSIVKIIKNSGHTVHLENHTDFVQELVSFLS